MNDEIINKINEYMKKVSFYNGRDDKDFFNKRKIYIYNEISLQHSLGAYLRKHLKGCVVLFERNIRSYSEYQNFVKSEIDIVIVNKQGEHYAIELKVPLNGQTKTEMEEFIIDISFMEQVKNIASFNNTYVLTITNDNKFWETPKGRKTLKGLYPYFRGKVKEIKNKKFTFKRGNNQIRVEITNNYKVEWKNLNGDSAKYYFIKIE